MHWFLIIPAGEKEISSLGCAQRLPVSTPKATLLSRHRPRRWKVGWNWPGRTIKHRRKRTMASLLGQTNNRSLFHTNRCQRGEHVVCYSSDNTSKIFKLSRFLQLADLWCLIQPCPPQWEQQSSLRLRSNSPNSWMTWGNIPPTSSATWKTFEIQKICVSTSCGIRRWLF